MQLTRASEYGLRGMLHLARRAAGGIDEPVSLKAIGESEVISRKFLARLLKTLAGEGLVKVKRGKSGGYRLAKAPREISMLDIVEALEGPIMVNECVGNPSCCSQSKGCPMMSVWGEAQKKFVQELKETSLEKLVKKEAERMKE